MWELLKFGTTSFLFAFFALPPFIKVFEKYQIIDIPGKRKIHKRRKPTMGGLPVFLGLAAALLVWLPIQELISYKLFFGSLSLIFLIGLRDDLVPLNASQKLVSQIIPLLIIFFSGFPMVSSLFDLSQIQLPMVVSLAVSSLVILGIVNAYNLIDGADGLAGTLGVIQLLFFGIWFVLIDQFVLSFISFSLAGSFLAFLFYNWSPSKIFMGDTGSLVLGFTIAFLAIQFLHHNYLLSSSSPWRFEGTISTAICILVVPVFDTARVIVVRWLNGTSPLKADKNHIHHKLMRMGLNHSTLSLILGAANLAFIIGAILSRNVDDYVLLPVIILILVVIGIMLNRFTANRIPVVGIQTKMGNMGTEPI